MAFLAFEGLDGAGKSTLIESLVTTLKARQQRFVLTREPGGTPLAEEIRSLLLRVQGETPVARTELLLYAASRAQHVEGVIRPALLRGDWVLCDRFTASSVAFQCFARGLERTSIDWLNQFAVAGVTPQLNILLDLPVAESLRRLNQRADAGQVKDRFENEKREFHEKVRRGYLAQAQESPESWLVLNAERTPAEMFQTLLAELQKRGVL